MGECNCHSGLTCDSPASFYSSYLRDKSRGIITFPGVLKLPGWLPTSHAQSALCRISDLNLFPGIGFTLNAMWIIYRLILELHVGTHGCS